MKRIVGTLTIITAWLILDSCGTQIEKTSTQEADTQVDFSFTEQTINLADIPAYSGDAYIEINDNVPFLQTTNYQQSPLNIILNRIL